MTIPLIWKPRCCAIIMSRNGALAPSRVSCMCITAPWRGSWSALLAVAALNSRASDLPRLSLKLLLLLGVGDIKLLDCLRNGGTLCRCLDDADVHSMHST